MIVLYPVLVLSVIAGNGIVFADDAAPASTSAPATPAASASDAALSTNSTPARMDAPPVPAVTTAKDTPSPSKAEGSKTNTDDNEEAPMADNSDSYKADKVNIASALERITRMLDANPTPSRGSAAIPLLDGKNNDFFLLRVPKHVVDAEKATVKQEKDVGRSLEPPSYDYNRQYPNSAVLANEKPPCLCYLPPPQVAPDLSALQYLYGNALTFNGMLDPGCPPGQVQNIVQTGLAVRMMPAVDGIPVLGVNSLGQSSYQYSPSSQNNYQVPEQNQYPFQNPYNPSIPGQFLESSLGSLQYPQDGGNPPPYPQNGASPPPYPQNGASPPQYPQNGASPPPYPQNGAFPPLYPQNGAFPPPYPQNGALLLSYPQNGAFPSLYPQNEALSSPQNGVLPLSNAQNGGFPLPYLPPGAIPSLNSQNSYNPQMQSQQYKQNNFVSYGQSPVSALFGDIQSQQTSGFLGFPESSVPENKGYDFKSAKSLW